MHTGLLGYTGSWKWTYAQKHWKMATNQSEVLERMLSDDFETAQSNIDTLDSEDSDAGAVEIQGYLPRLCGACMSYILAVVLEMETAMFLRGVGEPQRT